MFQYNNNQSYLQYNPSFNNLQYQVNYQNNNNTNIQETYLPKTDFSTVTIKIQDLSNEVVDKFNSIMYEDSHFFIFKDNNQLDRAKNPLFDRVISVN